MTASLDGIYGTMASLWGCTIRPLLEAADARNVLEIGADKGDLTIRLIEHCKARKGTACAVDPRPRFDAEAWEAAHGGAFLFRRSRSMEGFPGAPQLHAVLIDGDHNYHTVLEELRMLRREQASMPLVILHDTGWPYGRRDLYYDPDAVPAEGRRPHARAGLLLDGTMSPDGGINPHMEHALEEGGERNGVLTAIETFLTETGDEMEFLHLPGVQGLGIIAPRTLLEAKPALAGLLRDLRPTEALQRHLQGTEDDRLRAALLLAGGDLTTRSLAEANAGLQLQLDATLRERDELALALAAAEERRRAAQACLDCIRRTKSWRMTAWLRRAEKRLMRLLGRA